MNDKAMAGPALAAAACPVSTKMPAPMIAPTPRAMRLTADKVRFSGMLSWVVSAWTSGSSASALSTAIGFRAHRFAMARPSLSGPADMSQTLPHAGHQPIADPFAVFGIAGQVAHEELLLGENPPDDAGDEAERDDDTPQRAERDRRGKEHDQGADIHRMAHDGVGTGGDDRLVRRDLDDGCRVAVGLEGDEHDGETYHHQDVGHDDERSRYMRPAEAMVQARKDKQQHEQGAGEPEDLALDRLLLGDRTALQAALDQRRVVFEEVKRHHENAGREHDPVRPALPERERPGGQHHEQ